jgi:hypothetical protein
MAYPDRKPKAEPKPKPATREEYLRDLITGHEFVILNKGEQVAEGKIIEIVNVNDVILEIRRKDDWSNHYFSFGELKWDEFTRTGFAFDALPQHETE